MNKNKKNQTFGLGQKVSFGLGSYAQWFINGAFNTWVFTFYFSAVKVNILLIMLAFSLWTIWNAINDPLIGFFSDKTHTRFGRRKPYIMIGAIPILIIEIIVWFPRPGNDILNFIYLLIMLVCYDTFYTMVALPYDSLFPELYTSVEERGQVNTIKQIFSIVGLILAFLIPEFLIGDSVADPTGYILNGIVTTILVGIPLLISIIFGVKEREEFKQDYKHELSYFEALKYSLKNKGFILYTAMFFFYEYILLILSTTVPLYGEHVLKVTATFQTSLLLGFLFIVGLLTVIIWKKLDLLLGSRKSYAVSIVVYFISTLPLLFIQTYEIAIIIVAIMGFGFGGMLYFIYLIIADIIDEDELVTGVRREGTFFGVTNFFMRLAFIASILTVGIVFNSTGWEEYIPAPGVDVITGLKILVVIFPGIALGITLLCLYFYPFPKERVEEIKKNIALLHAKKKEKVDR